MTETTIIMIGGGTVTALAGGPLSISDLGARRTRRVSRIEFDQFRDRWIVTDAETGVEMCAMHNYDEALHWERMFYNELLAAEELTPAV
jgi:hypothetical protein